MESSILDQFHGIFNALNRRVDKVPLRFAEQKRYLVGKFNNLGIPDEKLFAISQQAERLIHAISGIKVVELGHEIQEFRSKYLRVLDKKLLRAWWKIQGVPNMSTRASNGCKKLHNARRSPESDDCRKRIDARCKL